MERPVRAVFPRANYWQYQRNMAMSWQRLDIGQHILADGYGPLALPLESRVMSFNNLLLKRSPKKVKIDLLILNWGEILAEESGHFGFSEIDLEFLDNE